MTILLDKEYGKLEKKTEKHFVVSALNRIFAEI